MSKNQEEQEKEELKVFGRFLEAKGIRAYKVNDIISCKNLYTYEKRNPPEPDIILYKPDGSVVVFELVEILDESFAGMQGLQFKTIEDLNNFYKNLTPEKKDYFDQKYKNALLYFRFSPKSTAMQRQKILPKIFNKLLELKNEYNGDAFEEDPAFSNILNSISISRGEFKGPSLDVESAGFINDPIVERLKNKFEKEYNTSHPIELLMYNNINPIPLDISIENLREYLEAQPKPFPFKNIWIFDYPKNEIKFYCYNFGIGNSNMKEELIYHYCNIESFYEIIKSRVLRLSNAFKMNDYYEGKWILNIFDNLFKELKISINMNVVKSYYKTWIELYRPHIACFSKEEDLLSLWLGYANDANGLSIGFDRNYFEAIAECNNAVTNKNEKPDVITIQDVTYEEKDQKQKLKEVIDSEEFKEMIIANKDLNLGDIFVAMELLKLGVIFKNEGFYQEHEVRIIKTFEGLASAIEYFGYMPDTMNPFQYKASNNDLKSFIELPLNSENIDIPAIKKVIIGPKCRVNEQDIKEFVQKYFGYKIKVTKSKISYC
jgi:hypothetical protein